MTSALGLVVSAHEGLEELLAAGRVIPCTVRSKELLEVGLAVVHVQLFVFSEVWGLGQLSHAFFLLLNVLLVVEILDVLSFINSQSSPSSWWGD